MSWARTKYNQILIEAFWPPDTFELDHWDSLMSFHSVHCMCRTGSCTVIGMEASERGRESKLCSRLRVLVASSAAQFTVYYHRQKRSGFCQKYTTSFKIKPFSWCEKKALSTRIVTAKAADKSTRIMAATGPLWRVWALPIWTFNRAVSFEWYLQ